MLGYFGVMMKILVWSVFGVLALLWTGVCLISAEVLQWASQSLAASNASALETATHNIVIPPAVSPLLEPAAWATLLQSVQAVLASTAAAIPLARSVFEWLVPLVWVVWALGLLAFIALALGLRLLFSRYYSFERLAR